MARVNIGDGPINEITVLYYNTQNDFAVLINTLSGDEIILCKSPQGETFNEIYQNTMEEAKKFKGDTEFYYEDQIKIPYLEFKEMREYYELEGKILLNNKGKEIEIEDALQTIEFSLDERGGKIKSEAAIATDFSGATEYIRHKPRYFYLDNTFAIFLREQGRDIPYFAARIDNITKYQ